MNLRPLSQRMKLGAPCRVVRHPGFSYNISARHSALDLNTQTGTRKLVDHSEELQAPATERVVHQEVNGPNVVIILLLRLLSVKP